MKNSPKRKFRFIFLITMVFIVSCSTNKNLSERYTNIKIKKSKDKITFTRISSSIPWPNHIDLFKRIRFMNGGQSKFKKVLIDTDNNNNSKYFVTSNTTIKNIKITEDQSVNRIYTTNSNDDIWIQLKSDNSYISFDENYLKSLSPYEYLDIEPDCGYNLESSFNIEFFNLEPEYSERPISIQFGNIRNEFPIFDVKLDYKVDKINKKPFLVPSGELKINLQFRDYDNKLPLNETIYLSYIISKPRNKELLQKRKLYYDEIKEFDFTHKCYKNLPYSLIRSLEKSRDLFTPVTYRDEFNSKLVTLNSGKYTIEDINYMDSFKILVEVKSYYRSPIQFTIEGNLTNPKQTFTIDWPKLPSSSIKIIDKEIKPVITKTN